MSNLDLLSNFDLTPVKRYTFNLSSDERPLNIFYKEQVLAVEVCMVTTNFTDEKITKLNSFLTVLCRKHKVDELCVFLLWDETGYQQEWCNVLHDIAKNLKILDSDGCLRVYLSGDCDVPADSNFNFRILPYFLIISWLQYCGVNFSWNPCTGKAMYLSGKFAKPDRLTLLKKITDSDLYQHIIESTVIPLAKTYSTVDITQVEEFMKNYDSTWISIDHWAELHKHYVDIDESVLLNDISYTILPIDALRAKSLMLVTETWHHCSNFLTEKTFNPICLGMPFIIYNDDFVDELHKMGFISCNSLVDNHDVFVPNKVDPYDTNYYNHHGDQILRRAELFLHKSCHDKEFAEQVQQVIDHNKQRAQEIVLSLVDEYNSYLGLVFNHIFQSQPPVILR